MLDIRTPLGLLFLAIGVLLAGWGLASDPAIYAASLDININLIWGVAMAAFGAAVLLIARSARRRR